MINVVIRFCSGLLNIPALRRLRLRLRLLLDNRCPEPGLANFSLPVAVTRTRFAAALFVFFFGISTPP